MIKDLEHGAMSRGSREVIYCGRYLYYGTRTILRFGCKGNIHNHTMRGTLAFGNGAPRTCFQDEARMFAL